MFKDKKIVTVFHLLVIEDSSEIVQSYVKSIVDCGLYDDCDKFIFNIRYTNFDEYIKCFNILKKYDKFCTISCDHNDSDFSMYVQEYCNYNILETIRKRKHCLEYLKANEDVPLHYRLGEVETIMNLICNPNFKSAIEGYDYGLFFHSKSMSHLSNINDHPKSAETTVDDIKNIMRDRTAGYKNLLDRTIEDDRFTHYNGNVSFAFKCEWLTGMNIEKYFKIFQEYEHFDFTNYPVRMRSFSFRRGNMFLAEEDGKFTMADRHIFYDFPSNVNFMADQKGSIKCLMGD